VTHPTQWGLAAKECKGFRERKGDESGGWSGSRASVCKNVLALKWMFVASKRVVIPSN